MATIHAFRTRRGAEKLRDTCATKFPLHTFAVVNHPSDFKFCVAVMVGGNRVRAYVEKRRASRPSTAVR